MPRLFTGLEIPEDVCQTLSNLRGGLPGARWIDPENYHVTLRFIGDIDGVSANEIAMLLTRIDRKPFEVTVQGLSSFGGKKPRAVVATIQPSRPLIELQAELERLMQRLGLDPEGRRLSLGARLFPQQGLHRRSLRSVLLPRLHRRRTVCRRGFLRAECVGSRLARLRGEVGAQRAPGEGESPRAPQSPNLRMQPLTRPLPVKRGEGEERWGVRAFALLISRIPRLHLPA